MGPEITDIYLQEFLDALTGLIGDGDSIVEFWTGGNDIATQDEWKWLHSGTTISETFWYGTQPNGNIGEDCIAFLNNYDISESWFDRDCDATNSVVCQKSFD